MGVFLIDSYFNDRLTWYDMRCMKRYGWVFNPMWNNGKYILDYLVVHANFWMDWMVSLWATHKIGLSPCYLHVEWNCRTLSFSTPNSKPYQRKTLFPFHADCFLVRSTKGEFLVKLKIAFVPVKRVHSVNTYLRISTVSWGSEQSEWVSPWTEQVSKASKPGECSETSVAKRV